MSADPSVIIINPLDHIAQRYGEQLLQLGGPKARLVMARALNYEGRKAHSEVKRTLRGQTSIPSGLIAACTRFRNASAKGGALETSIDARGNHLSMKLFRPRQFAYGAAATVWGKRQRFRSAFGAPGDNPAVVGALRGHVFHRVSSARLPIQKLWGPNLAIEMVKDQSRETFLAASARIPDRVAKEIAAVLRGY
jgi:hypothetical protein